MVCKKKTNVKKHMKRSKKGKPFAVIRHRRRIPRMRRKGPKAWDEKKISPEVQDLLKKQEEEQKKMMAQFEKTGKFQDPADMSNISNFKFKTDKKTNFEKLPKEEKVEEVEEKIKPKKQKKEKFSGETYDLFGQEEIDVKFGKTKIDGMDIKSDSSKAKKNKKSVSFKTEADWEEFNDPFYIVSGKSGPTEKQQKEIMNALDFLEKAYEQELATNQLSKKYSDAEKRLLKQEISILKKQNKLAKATGADEIISLDPIGNVTNLFPSGHKGLFGESLAVDFDGVNEKFQKGAFEKFQKQAENKFNVTINKINTPKDLEKAGFQDINKVLAGLDVPTGRAEVRDVDEILAGLPDKKKGFLGFGK